MTEPYVEPRVRARYETRSKTPVWPFAIGAVLVAGVGGFLLASQAYRPPYLETTTVQALASSAMDITIRTAPLAVAAFAALHFGLLRRAAPRQAPAWGLAIVLAAVAGVGAVVGVTHLEKAAYQRDGREAMQTLLRRTSDRYEYDVLLNHAALNNRLRTVLGPSFFLRLAYQDPADRDYDRLRGELADARQSAENHRDHVATHQAEAIERIQRARISRFGKAEAIADLRARFGRTGQLRDLYFTLFEEILSEAEAQVGVLEQANGRWRGDYFVGVRFDNAADLESFNAGADRIDALVAEINDVTHELTEAGRRVRQDAVDRAVAEQEAERMGETAAD